MDWIIKNAKWIFDGIGGVIFTVIVGLIFKSKSRKSKSQSIKSGNNSTNIQSGNDINIKIGGKSNDK